jgi:hypothetical protein
VATVTDLPACDPATVADSPRDFLHLAAIEAWQAITRTVTASIWFGITTGYLTLAGSYQVPRRFLV